MKVALVGFRGSGKTTVFNALTGQEAQTGFGRKDRVALGRIEVPDPRVDTLSEMYHPQKTIHAEIQFIDMAGPESDAVATSEGLDAGLVANIREAEALALVARDFGHQPDPVREIAGFEDELILTDQIQIEKRLERLRKEKKTPERDLLEKLLAALEEGQPIRRLSLEEAERQLIAGFSFLSQKPTLVVLNRGEDTVGEDPPEAALRVSKERELTLMTMCATIEAEILSMSKEDQGIFLEDLGLSESMRSRFIQAAYEMLDLISFLTIGEDEVRAWTIRRGTPARTAAGKIHTDLERGFIRAEVTRYGDLIDLGSEAKVKEAGKMRLEGKEYVVQDGDIVSIRHSS